MERNVIIMGSRGYTRDYGGWETLVHGMIDNWQDLNTTFYVTEVTHNSNEERHVVVNNVHCIRIYVKNTGSLKMIFADALVLKQLPRIIREYKITNVILYCLGARVGPLFFLMKPMLKKYNIAVVENSDGMNWKREKHSLIERLYINFSMRVFNKHVVEYLVCDSEEMKRISVERLKGRRMLPKMKTIYYGTNEAPVLENKRPEKVQQYFDEHGLTPGGYYLIINRFVPENSYEMIIREFMQSNTISNFVIVSNIDQENKYYEKLREELSFDKDKRIKFVGTLYDKAILVYLRQRAQAYINGHTLGGTNPGLLEALATTDVNLVRDCPFSREGAGDTALYFSEEKPLRELIAYCDSMSNTERRNLGIRAKERMRAEFGWDKVNQQYVELFDEICLDKFQ